MARYQSPNFKAMKRCSAGLIKMATDISPRMKSPSGQVEAREQIRLPGQGIQLPVLPQIVPTADKAEAAEACPEAAEEAAEEAAAAEAAPVVCREAHNNDIII
jgi:hypothetical protein